MAKLEQKKGLYGGFKPGSTGGPGTGKVKRAVKNVSRKIKNKAQEVASNVKKNQENKKNDKVADEIAAEGSSKNPRFLQGKDLPKDPKAGVRKLPPAVQKKMGYNSMSQKRMGLHQQKEERRFAQDRALEAGGSRPMHQATTSQIDPLTGMPLQANAPQMGNFSGFNEIPMYDQSMNPGAIAQKRNLDEY